MTLLLCFTEREGIVNRQRMILSIIVTVLGLYLGLILILYLFQARLIYFPTRPIDATPADIGLRYEDVRLKTSDGVALAGWFIPVDHAKGTVLFFHGNAGNISHRLQSVDTFHQLGLNVFIIDYRGYGQSEGSPGERGTYRDAEAAWHYLTREKQIPADEIIVFGRSLGGGVGTWLVRKHRPGALILESTFTAVPDLAAEYYPFLPVRWLARIQYNTVSLLPEVNCPVLIVHSSEDEIIPYHHGQRLFAVAKEPKAFIELQGGHNEGFFISGETYQQGLTAFIDDHLIR